MKTIEIYGTLTFDDEYVYQNDDEQDFFEHDVLLGGELSVLSETFFDEYSDRGNCIGTVKLIKLTEST